MSLDTIKSLLGVDNPQVGTIFSMIRSRLHRRLSRDLDDGELIATGLVDLDYILIEVTIERYNRIGSEGAESESVDGHSVKYIKGDPLAGYEHDIVAYIDSLDNKRTVGVVRFL